MATRDSNIIVFVIIHGNELYYGSFFWLNLILSKKWSWVEDHLKESLLIYWKLKLKTLFILEGLELIRLLA